MPARPAPRPARSPSAASLLPGRRSIPACIRPTSAARWRSPCSATSTRSPVLDAGMKLSHFGGGGRPYSHDMRVARDAVGGVQRQPLPRHDDRRREQAFRHAGRRQPFLLCRPCRFHRTGRARHASRLAQARRAALQGRHGPGREPSPAPVAGDAGAQCLDSLRDRRWAGLLGGAAAHAHLDQEEPLRDPRRGRAPPRHQGQGPLLERAQLRVPQERRPVLSRQGRDPGLVRLRRRLERAHADPAQHGRADPDRARPRCRERPRLRAARRGPQLQPLGLHAAARREDGSADGGGADQGHRCALLLRHPRRLRAARAPTRMRPPCAGKSPSSAWPRSSTPSSPIGCIMAGDWQRDAPWRKKKAGRAKQRSRDANGDR